MAKEPDNIGKLLNELFTRRSWQRKLAQHAVFLFWEEVVGEGIAGRARPDVLRGEVLWVKVTDSVWMQQLHLQKTLLLQKINGRLPDGQIKDIRFRLGNLRDQPAAPADPVPQNRPDPQARRDFEEIISPLQDSELREVLRRLWTKSQCR